MKHKRVLLTITALIMNVVSVLAADYVFLEIDGIRYAVNTETKVAEVFHKSPLYTGNVVIPAIIDVEDIVCNVISIAEHAFQDCTDLASVFIPSSITSIGDGAFYGCTGLTTVTIPSSVTTIGKSAFNGCTGLTSVTISEGVTEIGNSAFDCCKGLTSVTIPSSVSTIGAYAFEVCTGLTSVTISEGVTTIGRSAFNGCKKLSSVIIPPSVTTIGGSAFSGCTGLTSVSIPSSVTTIETGAFTLTGLTSVTLPSSMTSIGGYVFSQCENLSSVNIPSSVTSIGNYAFLECTGLTSVDIPSSVTTIGNGAFQGCTGLTSVIIPSSTTSIGNYAFSQCSDLTSVVVGLDEPVSISSYTFSNRMNATLYVPNGCKLAYLEASIWQDFKEIIEMSPVIVGSTGFATYCSPVDLDYSAVSGIKAYIASGFDPSTGTLVLTRVTKVPANEGLYITGAQGSYTIPVTSTDMVYSNLLKGVTTATTIYPTDGSNTNFILANGNYGVGFYTLSEAGELAAGKAYLQLPTASVSNVKAMNFVFNDDSETSINDTKDVSEVKEVYNLQGQRVRQPKHGLYIINGKKFIIK